MAKSTDPDLNKLKTNACRALDALGIAYSLRAYDVDEDDLSTETVAKKMGLPAEQVWKTLCLRANDNAIVLALVSADRELDFKLAAKLAGKKSLEPVAVKELVGLTGYIRGGVTALACVYYFRRVAFASVRNFFFKFLAPLVGGVILAVIFVTTLMDSMDPDYGSGSQIGGVGLVFILGVFLLATGVVLMFVMRAVNPAFFTGKTLRRGEGRE